MKSYLDSLQYILDHGTIREDRTGVGTIGVFGLQMRFDLAQGFPAVTTKKLAWRACVSELLWFIEGSSDERRLAEITHGSRESGPTIWTQNARSNYWTQNARFEGDLGRVYGVQWRHWKKYTKTDSKNWKDEFGNWWRSEDGIQESEIDQLDDLIYRIKKDPYSRRHILSSWNVSDLDQMALPPCHCLAQFYVADGKLSCQMYQRSADFPLGVPFNIASYSLLTHMIAQVCDLDVGEFIWSGGDCHIYLNQIDGIKEQLKREPRPLPTLWINPEIKEIENFKVDDFKLIGYDPHPSITFDFAV